MFRSPSKLWLVLGALAVLVADVSVANAAAESKAVSNGSDWFGTNSGWITERVFHGNTAPTGTYSLEYKHWFGAATEPAGWTVKATPAKPPAATWDSAPSISDTKTTTRPSSSYAKSDWYIDPYKAPDILGGGFYSKYQTRSYANSSSATGKASCKTRITDPWVFLSPETDPDGLWEVGGHITMFGDILAGGDLGGGQIFNSYSIALNSMYESDAKEFLSISITPEGSDVTVTAPTGTNILLYSGNYTTASLVTESALEAKLDSYLTASGWNLKPSFDFDEFRPADDLHLDEVFSLFAFVQLDSDYTSATVFTSTSSYATAAVPEPAALAVWSALGGLGLIAARFRRRVV